VIAGAAPIEEYLVRPMRPPDPRLLDALERPMDPADAVRLPDLDRLLDPNPLAVESGWCVLPDGVGYVAVRTEMPDVTGEMVDWWFDWHPRDESRYRAWHPKAHIANGIERGGVARAKAHWGAVHRPVEDIGTGVVRARIAFRSPTEIGFSTDALHDPRVATIVCGYAGDEDRHVQHTVMAHVFLHAEEGVVLRSRFWLGAALRPYLPAALAVPASWAMNNRRVRAMALPKDAPRALARHCAEEFTNLGSLLPELYRRFG